MGKGKKGRKKQVQALILGCSLIHVGSFLKGHTTSLSLCFFASSCPTLADSTETLLKKTILTDPAAFRKSSSSDRQLLPFLGHNNDKIEKRGKKDKKFFSSYSQLLSSLCCLTHGPQGQSQPVPCPQASTKHAVGNSSLIHKDSHDQFFF